MTSNLDKLKKLLAELFQLDQADLDFGIYRIMNQKRDEITRFLEQDLLPQVQEAFGIYKSADRAELEEELEKTIQGAKAAGFEPEESPKVKEIRDGLAKYGVDTTALENEVFSDLFNFFRRYYHEGDFLSLRRYKKGVYAIPYEGEEVKLHWANHDQYYIKTSEYLRDYTFKLPSGKRVHFKLTEADTEKDNIKAQTGNERRFILCEEEPLEEMDGELYIRFQYIPDAKKRKQKDLNVQAVDAVLNAKGFIEWRGELARPMPTEKNPKRTLLQKHLTDYTARNTFDYFIHKDLGGFLKRELDFYIKNEIMHLDDIENETAPRVEQYLSKIRVIRKIAHKIIDFLAQIENFQKRLWLKKKFVVETNYCMTLDRVPEALYPEIAANEEQREEWVRLFAIDEIERNLIQLGYSEPLTVEFLKANPFLVLDTAFFSGILKNKLIGHFDNLDFMIDGLMIHGENSQALRLLQERFSGTIDCQYIDPPYNTGKDGFLYKDQYQHSSWISMLNERVALGKKFLTRRGAHLCSTGDQELPRLLELHSEIFGYGNHISTFIWNTDGNIDNQSKIKQNHEYVISSALNERSVPAPEVIDPNVSKGSKLYRDTIINTIVKNGPANPVSEIVVPAGFPADFQEGVIEPGKAQYPKFEKTVNVVDGKLTEALAIRSGWSSRNLIDKFIKGGMEPIYDSKGVQTTFIIKDTGAPYVVKQRSKRQGHVLTVLRNMGSTQSMAGVLRNMGVRFDYPKPIGLLRHLIAAFSNTKSIILDYFAGSGTTAQAVIDLNREDDGHRRYVLVELGEHFNKIIRPRLAKNIYSKDWKDGKPVSREGSSHMFKYIRLESYEDTLNNLELKRTEAQQSLLEQSDLFRESYMLSYMLDVESKGSASLLNVDSFEDPFNYKLKIATGSAGETRPVTVDLVETFNYLLGLTVHHIDHIRGFRVVQGINPKGEKVLVIWRNLKDKSNKDLDEFFRKQEYSPKDMEFDLIYVNGDNNLENLRRDDETWKVRLIEEDFKRLMFDVQDV